MTRNLKVLNLSRVNHALGLRNVPPAKTSNVPVNIDLNDGSARKALAGSNNIIPVGGDWNVQHVIVPLGVGTAGGGVASWLNPEGKRIHVLRVDLDVTTAATGAATVSVGVGATATTAGTQLASGLDVHTAATLLSTATATAAGAMVPAGQFVNLSQASGAVAGLVGNALITYAVAA